jgi:hypothetical protein
VLRNATTEAQERDLLPSAEEEIDRDLACG